ncbi:unnamed protein product [Ranitomeya imitator]|uniref:Helix-turn-helix domain-containing protein n=1 Tax=Ranitomeya imitator TaxID=111125 RepID=A0ABN9KMD0_9NEOB|nr:unnamed protein product [Ranitomeya imitator]
MAYINHQGTTRSKQVLAEVSRILRYAEHLVPAISAVRIPGVKNWAADFLSRQGGPRIAALSFSASPLNYESRKKDKGEGNSRNSRSSELVKKDLVRGAGEHAHGHSLEDVRPSRSHLTRSPLPPEFTVSEFKGLAIEAAILKDDSFSQQVIQNMIRARNHLPRISITDTGRPSFDAPLDDVIIQRPAVSEEGDGAAAQSARRGLYDPVVGWFRYIDDVLLIWNGDDTSLSKFMQQFNINPFNLKFTYNWHPNKIDFLDISLCVGEDGAIETDLYRKETSVNSLLHASSAHNYSTIKAIPVGQFLRNRRVCSTEERFEKQSVALTDRFHARGCSHQCIKAGYRRAKNTRREDLLVQPKKSKQTDEPMVRFISTSNCHWDRIHGILSKHWSVLRTDPMLTALLPASPMMTQRRSKNLRDNLVRSHYVAKQKTFFIRENIKFEISSLAIPHMWFIMPRVHALVYCIYRTHIKGAES